MKSRLSVILVLTSLLSCNKKQFFDGPNSFQDSFENYSVLEELLLPNDELWSFTQVTRDLNNISIDTQRASSGLQSLHFFAEASDNNGASKASIAKQNMAFWEGETVQLRATYFIEDEGSLEWLFLMDIEEQTAIGAGPGMRLALVDDQLRIEYKFFEQDIIQDLGKEVDFPRNEWVEIVWKIKLSTQETGRTQLFQNGSLIIDRNEIRTLPSDFLYFQQGTKGMYSSCEIGITANSQDQDVTLWVDDIAFEQE